MSRAARLLSRTAYAIRYVVFMILLVLGFAVSVAFAALYAPSVLKQPAVRPRQADDLQETARAL